MLHVLNRMGRVLARLLGKTRPSLPLVEHATITGATRGAASDSLHS
jgi:hypothetical protein